MKKVNELLIDLKLSRSVVDDQLISCYRFLMKVKDADFPKILEHSIGEYYMTPFTIIQQEIQEKAQKHGIKLKGDSVIIGYTPKEAARKTMENLLKGCNWDVEKSSKYHM